ncbi:MAG TPA: DUF1015 family protein [Pseudonocardia sp.]|nr:DUF1015 family protein [Pseudonocardia sp.]
MTGWARAIGTGWVVRDRVPGPSVDEFAEPDEVVAALAGQGDRDTLLAVQHPHRTPRARAAGLSLTEALPAARQALARLRATAYRQVNDVVAAYRVSGPDGSADGVLCLVDPAAVDHQGLSRVRSSEQVYPGVVAERAAVLAALGCATSAAMLVPVDAGDRLTEAVLRTVEPLGAPSASTVDSGGRVHRLWLVGPGAAQDALLAEVRRGPLLVADGNHRVAAATGAPSDLLALVTGGPGLRIGAIHRALVGTGLSTADLAAAWRRRGLVVHETDDLAPPHKPGTVVVRPVTRPTDPGLLVELPGPEAIGEPPPRLDHALVERVLVADALGIDPSGPQLHPLPAGHPAGDGVDAVLQLAPTPFDDVLTVHRQGRRMPRKSTYFTPKPRSGLLLADL